MPALRRPDIRVVLGKGGSGKSYLVRHWLKSTKGRVLIFDSAAEADYANNAFMATSPRELVDYLIGDARGAICYREAMPTRDGFEVFNRAAWSAENLTVVWEEVDRWSDAGRLPDHAFAMVNQGRHRGIRIIATARRPHRVSRDLTANASRIVAFKSVEPRDLAYLADYIGRDAPAMIGGLTEFQAVDWTEAAYGVRKSPFK
jgi:hypothetical protein